MGKSFSVNPLVFEVRQSVGIVLAGGKSRRMGTDKASLVLEGRSMLSWACEPLVLATQQVVIVAAEESKLPDDVRLGERIHLVFDERPDEGPLQGLCTGLRAAAARNGSLAFVTTCDAPFLRPAFVRRLLMLLANDGGYDCAAPKIGERWNLLSAAYRIGATCALQELLAQGERRMRALPDTIRVLAPEESTLRAVDPELVSLYNINTPEEFAHAQERLEP